MPLPVGDTSLRGGVVGNLRYSQWDEELFIIQSSFFLEKTAIPIAAIVAIMLNPGSDESSFFS